jgi:hypothetical protein
MREHGIEDPEAEIARRTEKARTLYQGLEGG